MIKVTKKSNASIVKILTGKGAKISLLAQQLSDNALGKEIDKTESGRSGPRKIWP